MKRLKLLFIPCAENHYRPHILGRAGIMVLVALMLVAEGYLVTSVVVRQAGGNFLAAVESAALIALTNGDRSSYRLTPLTESNLLDIAAQAKANDMAAKGYFSHVGPDGKEPWSWIATAGYKYDYAGENLAVHFADSSDVENAWMASPTHRANILKSQYTNIGIGIAQGFYQGQPATYVVQYFGSPAREPVARLPAAAPAQTGASAQAGAVAQASPESTNSSLPPASPAESSPPSSAAASIAGAITPGETVNPAAPVKPAPQENAFLRGLLRLGGSPRETAIWTLIGITILLIVAIGLTFAIHMRIQPMKLLLGGATVAGMAAFFLMLDTTFLTPTISITGQAASVASSPLVFPDAAGASAENSVLITPAASTTPACRDDCDAGRRPELIQ